MCDCAIFVYSAPTLTPCHASSSHNTGYLLKDSFSTAIKLGMLNFTRNLAMPLSGIYCRPLAIGAYVEGPSLRAMACCFVNHGMLVVVQYLCGLECW